MPVQGSNIHLKLDGITGESQESKHKGEIDILHYAESIHNLASGGTGMGGGVGRAEYGDFSFTCKMEKSVPNLMKFCADHKPIAKAVLSCTKVGGSGASYNYLQVTLSNARVSSVSYNGAMNSENDVSVTLNFEKIKTEYWEENATGGQGASVNAEWSNKENKAG